MRSTLRNMHCEYLAGTRRPDGPQNGGTPTRSGPQGFSKAFVVTGAFQLGKERRQPRETANAFRAEPHRPASQGTSNDSMLQVQSGARGRQPRGREQHPRNTGISSTDSGQEVLHVSPRVNHAAARSCPRCRDFQWDVLCGHQTEPKPIDYGPSNTARNMLLGRADRRRKSSRRACRWHDASRQAEN